MTLSAKIKYYLFNTTKIVIAVVAFYFIYEKISKQPLDKIIAQLSEISLWEYAALLFLGIFSIANWLTEIKKWKNLSENIKKISFVESGKIVLSSFATSIVTPNRVGEYGAKVLFYEKSQWKRVLGFSFIGNMMQLNVTLAMMLAFYNFVPKIVSINIPEYVYIFAILISIILTVVLFGVGLYRKFPNLNLRIDISSLSKFYFKDRMVIFALSLLRYLFFSIQLLFLLSLFGVEISLENYSIVTINYFLVSVIPTIFLGDLLIRGSVAIFLFSLIGVNEIVVVSVVFVAWIYNFVIPALFGSVLMLKTKI